MAIDEASVEQADEIEDELALGGGQFREPAVVARGKQDAARVNSCLSPSPEMTLGVLGTVEPASAWSRV